MNWSDNPAVWQMACEMCAEDVCFWCSVDELVLVMGCNDVFARAADSEDVQPDDVAKVYRIWKAGSRIALMQWISDRRGGAEFLP